MNGNNIVRGAHAVSNVMRAGESATSARWVGIHDFIERELVVAEAHSFAKQAKADSTPLDAYLCLAVLHFDARHEN